MTRRHYREWLLIRVVLAGFGASGICLPAAPADAAMRRCATSVTGTGEAAMELDARRLAMSEWQQQATRFGVGFTSWRLAIGKSFACAPQDNGVVFCRAAASPCTIEQNPNNLPRDIKKLPGTYRGPGEKI